MADPWLTIVGLGEDGPDGLSAASLRALESAQVIAGAPRHLALLPGFAAERMEWPVPWADGVTRLLALRGRRVVMLASGDPFWFGAGGALVRHLSPGEWRVLPGVSTFALAAARLGWALEDVACLGLHAAPLARMRLHLGAGRKVLALMRDGAAVAEVAALLQAWGHGKSRLHVLEALGGPRERLREASPAALPTDISHPVALAIEGAGAGLPLVPGLGEGLFEHDGQITKGPMRALTLAALAPRAGEYLWDIGTGSGSVAIEWLRMHRAMRATGFEASPARAVRARRNAAAFGLPLEVVEGRAPEVLAGQPLPDVVFIGGGITAGMLDWLRQHLRPGTRLVANAVTLDSEALLTQWQGLKGGALLRVDLSQAVPMGQRQGWRAAYPVVQWSVTL